jgi:iron complex transport system ATP-binding protein
MEETILLQTESISIGYQNKKAITLIAKEVSIGLKKGTLTALIGANGIGKSTLLKTITGIQKPLEGDVLLHGRNIGTYSTADLSQEMSLVLTEKLPPSNLTVYELVALGRQPYTNWMGTLTKEDTIQEHYRLHKSVIWPIKSIIKLATGNCKKYSLHVP